MPKKKVVTQTDDLDDLVTGSKPAAGKKAAKKAAAPEPEVEETEEVANETPEEVEVDAIAVANIALDLEPGNILRIPDSYTLRRCITCKMQYVADKESWKIKRCPVCVGGPKDEGEPEAPAALEPAEVHTITTPGGDLLNLLGETNTNKALAAIGFSKAFESNILVVLVVSSGTVERVATANPPKVPVSTTAAVGAGDLGLGD